MLRVGDSPTREGPGYATGSAQLPEKKRKKLYIKKKLGDADVAQLKYRLIN